MWGSRSWLLPAFSRFLEILDFAAGAIEDVAHLLRLPLRRRPQTGLHQRPDRGPHGERFRPHELAPVFAAFGALPDAAYAFGLVFQLLAPELGEAIDAPSVLHFGLDHAFVLELLES